MLNEISGTYRIEVKTSIGVEKGVLIMDVIDGKLQGSIKSDNVYSEFNDGIIKKNTFEFSGRIKKVLLNIKYVVIGKVEERVLTAKINTKYGVFYASGVKI
ncbi:MAG: hypothetical protein E7214_10885 [Clostridium sp.]|nr:hypothetical protein [Clostridium sp.]